MLDYTFLSILEKNRSIVSLVNIDPIEKMLCKGMWDLYIEIFRRFICIAYFLNKDKKLLTNQMSKE